MSAVKCKLYVDNNGVCHIPLPKVPKEIMCAEPTDDMHLIFGDGGYDMKDPTLCLGCTLIYRGGWWK